MRGKEGEKRERDKRKKRKHDRTGIRDETRRQQKIVKARRSAK